MKKILFLILILSQFIFAGSNVFIMKDGTEIKSKASNSSSTVLKVNRGVQVPLVGEEGSWYKVSKDGKVGYVYKKDGMKIKGSNSATKSSSKPKAKSKPTKKQDKKTKKLNDEWRRFEIDDMGDVAKANQKAQEGIDGAIYSLVEALEHKNEGVRNEAEICLVSIGERSIKPLGPKTKSKIYLVKSRAVAIIGKIKSAKGVPYLERVIKDMSIEEEVVNALNTIGGNEAGEAIARYNKSKIMDAKMDSIRDYKEQQDIQRLKKLGLTYGETKNNILDVAMKLAQFKKTNTPKSNSDYKEHREVFTYLVKKYDNKLGAGAAEQLLKDNGYSKDVLK